MINIALDRELQNMDSQAHAKLNELQVLINYKVCITIVVASIALLLIKAQNHCCCTLLLFYHFKPTSKFV